MKCANCQMEIPEIATFCPNCGHNNAEEMKTENTTQENVIQQPETKQSTNQQQQIQQSQMNQPIYTQPSYQQPTYQQPKTGGFFNFDKMVTLSIIKFIFIIGLIVIVLVGFGMMSEMRYYVNPLWFILGMLLAGVLWRVNCELLIIMFKIHENLVHIKNKQ